MTTLFTETCIPQFECNIHCFKVGFYLYCRDPNVKVESIFKVGFYPYRWDPNGKVRILP